MQLVPRGQANGNTTISTQPEPWFGRSHRPGRGGRHLGVVMAHYPMIFSGFRRIQTDLGDTRLIHYLLEHGYLWVRRVPGHLDFWSPPFFYPAQKCGGVFGRAPERRPGVLAVSNAGGVAGPVVRLVDGVDVGAQLCGRAAALPARGSVSGCRPRWRARRWWPSVRRG